MTSRFQHHDLVLLRSTTDPGDIDLPLDLDLSGRDAVHGEGRDWLVKLWARDDAREALSLASPDLAAQVSHLACGLRRIRQASCRGRSLRRPNTRTPRHPGPRPHLPLEQAWPVGCDASHSDQRSRPRLHPRGLSQLVAGVSGCLLVVECGPANSLSVIDGVDERIRELANRSPNFGFLLDHEPLLVLDGTEAEAHVYTDPNAALFKARRFGETLAATLVATGRIRVDGTSQFARLTALARDGVIQARQRDQFMHLSAPAFSPVCRFL